MQTAQILDFPHQKRAPATRPEPLRQELGQRGQWVDLFYIGRVLHLRAQGRRALAETVRRLVAGQGFPWPNMRLFDGRLLRGADAVCATSQFERAAVDAWVDHYAHADGHAAARARDRDAVIDARLMQSLLEVGGQ